ncbi:hypothetical protein GX411_05200 [Candidatus Fermentibacteria bacterium]|nr:hypothetical protein [Candidatus Fermentibacteria bacterium]
MKSSSHAGPRIAWFVSDHGWGHAARQREIIENLLESCPGAGVTVVTGVSPWFWRQVDRVSLVRWASGPVPREKPGRIDHEATRVFLTEFPGRMEDHLGECRGILESTGADLVVTDIDPVPAAAAFMAGLDCLAIGNFTWDWIYREMFPDLEALCDVIADLYQTAHYLRLPLGPPHSPFETSEDVGLVPGGSSRNASRAREILGRGRNLLVTLRDPLRAGTTEPALPRGWKAFCSLPHRGLQGVENIPPQELEARGLRYADLAAAADALLITPGYGTVSMALALGKPVIALDRDDFPEVPYLIRPLLERPASLILGPEEIGGSGLADALDTVVQAPAPPPLACDTDFVVSRILERAARGRDKHGRPVRSDNGSRG